MFPTAVVWHLVREWALASGVERLLQHLSALAPHGGLPRGLAASSAWCMRACSRACARETHANKRAHACIMHPLTHSHLWFLKRVQSWASGAGLVGPVAWEVGATNNTFCAGHDLEGKGRAAPAGTSAAQLNLSRGQGVPSTAAANRACTAARSAVYRGPHLQVLHAEVRLHHLLVEEPHVQHLASRGPGAWVVCRKRGSRVSCTTTEGTHPCLCLDIGPAATKRNATVGGRARAPLTPGSRALGLCAL